MCAFHLRNREVNVTWNSTRLDNTSTPVYLGVHLDKTLSYKIHICSTKQKVNARNIIRKLANSKWGSRAPTLRSSGIALYYSAAEYTCAVWARSTHANMLNSALHDCYSMITGCLKPTNIDSLHLLAGLAPRDIRRTVACRTERSRQVADTKHQLHSYISAMSRLKSRKGFLSFTKPLIARHHQIGNVGNTTARNINSHQNGIATS